MLFRKIQHGIKSAGTGTNEKYFDVIKAAFVKATNDAKQNPWPVISAILALILLNTLIFSRSKNPVSRQSAPPSTSLKKLVEKKNNEKEEKNE